MQLRNVYGYSVVALLIVAALQFAAFSVVLGIHSKIGPTFFICLFACAMTMRALYRFSRKS